MTKRAASTSKRQVVRAIDPASSPGELKAIGGSDSDTWNNLLANQLLGCLWTKHSDEQQKATQFEGTVSALIGIGPRDELEGMIGAQLLAGHCAAMECYRRTMLSEQTFEGRRENLAQANKLSRTFATLLEALNRHRGKGQQKMIVKHVHVHEGGQAIVGNVAGGGIRTKSENQPHAITHAPGQEMRSTNTERETVPVAGDDKR